MPGCEGSAKNDQMELLRDEHVVLMVFSADGSRWPEPVLFCVIWPALWTV